MDIENRKELSIELVNRLFFVSVFLQRSGNRQIANHGLNQSQFSVLGEIVARGDIVQTDLLGDLLLNKSNLSKIIKKLNQLDLIDIDTADDDRRKTVLNATTKGKKVWTECMEELNKMKSIFTAPLEDGELEGIVSGLRLLTEMVADYRQNKIGE